MTPVKTKSALGKIGKRKPGTKTATETHVMQHILKGMKEGQLMKDGKIKGLSMEDFQKEIARG